MPKTISRIAGCILFILITMSLVSLFYTPYPVHEINIHKRLNSISWMHWLGNDQYGRDILSLIMRGLLNSISVSVSALLLGSNIGIILGLFASLYAGGITFFIRRLSDFIFAFPSLIIAIMLSLWLGSGYLNSTLTISIFLIAVYIRFVSVAARNIWNEPYIQAAYLCGKNTWNILYDHILPSILPLIIVQSITLFSISIIIEASLSFIGLGFVSPQPSLGKMLYEGQTYFFMAPHIIFIPSIILGVFILAVQICGQELSSYFSKHYNIRLSD